MIPCRLIGGERDIQRIQGSTFGYYNGIQNQALDTRFLTESIYFDSIRSLWV